MSTKLSADFDHVFENLLPRQLVRAVLDEYGPPKRRPARVEGFDIIKAMVFHTLMGKGDLKKHLSMLPVEPISASAIAQRRERLDFEIFQELLSLGLAPAALESEHPDAFFKGLRIIVGDGSNFSVSNTAAILEAVPKAKARRFEAAFAKLGVWTLVEAAVHNPIAAAVGFCSDVSEMALAMQVIHHMPDQSIFLGDRYYGNGKFIGALLSANASKQVEFVVRVRDGDKAPQLRDPRRLADGSLAGWIESEDGGSHQVREVRAKVRRGKGGWSEVRIWTSIIDPKVATAKELMRLYAKRWEIELFYKEVKIDMRTATLLSSQTPQTALQEAAAIVLANAILARQRIAAARKGKVAPTSVSFGTTLQTLQIVWAMLSVAQTDIERRTIHQLFERLILQQTADPIVKRRNRSCPRAVRQPVKSWPRLTKTQSNNAEIEYMIRIS